MQQLVHYGCGLEAGASSRDCSSLAKYTYMYMCSFQVVAVFYYLQRVAEKVPSGQNYHCFASLLVHCNRAVANTQYLSGYQAEHMHLSGIHVGCLP